LKDAELGLTNDERCLIHNLHALGYGTRRIMKIFSNK